MYDEVFCDVASSKYTKEDTMMSDLSEAFFMLCCHPGTHLSPTPLIYDYVTFARLLDSGCGGGRRLVFRALCYRGFVAITSERTRLEGIR